MNREYFDRLANVLESQKLKTPQWARRANSLAWKLLTCDCVAARDPEMALQWAQRACKINDNDPEFLDTLALALADNGCCDDAVATQRRAIDLLAPNVPEETRNQFSQKLERYTQRLDSSK
jgi:Flp pilus assembly protein TadD